jgi:predicted Zn-dependent protease
VTGAPHPDLATATEKNDALAISDALEALIDAQRDTQNDREYAYRAVLRIQGDSAAYAYARASITGRLVQVRGLTAADLVPEIEQYARQSRRMDPYFRDGAATRLLGSLYVLAPGGMLEHGDSEQGLELLEALAKARPNEAANHLRVAEAYIALGDPEPGVPYLCYSIAHKEHLRPDDRRLLTRLIADAGGASALACSKDAAPR